MGTDAVSLLIPGKPDVERDAVAAAWEREVGPVVRIDRFWEPPAVDRRRVRLYGNDTFCLVLAQLLGLDLVSPPDDWLFSIEAGALGRQVNQLPLADAVGLSYPRFVKPMVPKQFTAAVYSDHASLLAEVRGLDADTQLIVSEVVDIAAEVRCFVLEGSVVSAACYEGVADPVAAKAFLNGLSSLGAAPRTFVIDVAFTGDRWVVVEANATWGAGLNGCSAQAAVTCLLASCGPSDERDLA